MFFFDSLKRIGLHSSKQFFGLPKKKLLNWKKKNKMVLGYNPYRSRDKVSSVCGIFLKVLGPTNQPTTRLLVLLRALKKIWVIIAPLVIWTTFFIQFVVLVLFLNYFSFSLRKENCKNGCWWSIFSNLFSLIGLLRNT